MSNAYVVLGLEAGPKIKHLNILGMHNVLFNFMMHFLIEHLHIRMRKKKGLVVYHI